MQSNEKIHKFMLAKNRKIMKNRFRCTLLAVVMLACALPAAAKKPETVLPDRGTKQRLERVEAEIDARRLALNRLLWSCYLTYAERARLTPPVMDFAGMNYAAIRDSVPQIARLHRAYLEADSVYAAVLRTDPEYASIHEEYVRVRDLDKNHALRRPNHERYQQMYARLRRDNPDYLPALQARNEAIRVRNMALVRVLMDYYRSQGRPMPTDMIRSQKRHLREEWPEIGWQESELYIMEELRRQLFEQQQRDRLDIPGKAQGETARIRGLSDQAPIL